MTHIMNNYYSIICISLVLVGLSHAHTCSCDLGIKPRLSTNVTVYHASNLEHTRTRLSRQFIELVNHDRQYSDLRVGHCLVSWMWDTRNCFTFGRKFQLNDLHRMFYMV